MVREMHVTCRAKIHMNTVRVLLIDADDGPPLGHHLTTLQAHNFRFTREATLADGLVALLDMSFDLVLLNLSLPDASAAESVRRTLEMSSKLPVIALVTKLTSLKPRTT